MAAFFLWFLIFLLRCHVYLFFSETNVEFQTSILACILIFHKIKNLLYIYIFFSSEDENRMY